MALGRKAAIQGGVALVGLVLLGVVLGFIAYAHHRAQNYLAGLPARLGIDIRQETDNVTYSQSYGGRTVFTVHAAKQIQHADGKYTLRNVGITLYGREADRADKIRGNEFEYDQKNGVLTAAGDVFLDLAAPAGKPGTHPAKPGTDDDRVVHVKTSGLTYLQKERVATTEKEIDFAAGGMTGKAVGATYSGATGVVDLKSAVEVHGMHDGRPVELQARAAVLDRARNVTNLEGARFVSEGSRGQQTMLADHAVVRITPDGTPERVDAEGNVSLSTAGGARGTSRLSGQRLEAALNSNGQLQNAHLAGAVRLSEDAPAGQTRGSAEDLRVGFDTAGRARQAVLTGAVELQSRTPTSTRTLHSGRLELALSGGGREKTALRQAEATGGVSKGAAGARLEVQEAAADGGNEHTEVAADTLVGRFAASGNLLTGLDGHGNTRLLRTGSDAAGKFLRRDTSSGQELRLELRVVPAPGATRRGTNRTELLRAEQRGNVESERVQAASKPGAADTVEHARAEDAVFDAPADRVLLHGSVQLTDTGSLLQAPSVTVDRATDTATATGGVKVSYLAADTGKTASSAEPVHVQAQGATLHKSTGVAEFTAPAGGVVRMWQGGSVVEAPVIDFEQKTKTVVAHGLAGSAGDAAVRAVLVGSPGKDGTARPVRVQGSVMRYVDAAGTVDLQGPVRVDDADGRLVATHAVLTLASPAAGTDKAAAPALLGGGRVERVVATGAVEVLQPGRKATGDRLVYTAATGTFVLTGTRAVLPRVADAVRGTITGTEIRFTSGEDSVVVTGGEAGRVRTETRVKQ